MNGRLDGKVAVVTGSGQGVGRGIARAMAAEGARCVIAEFNEESGGRVAEELRSEGSQAEYNTELFAERVLPQIADLFDDRWEDKWWCRGKSTGRVGVEPVVCLGRQCPPQACGPEAPQPPHRCWALRQGLGGIQWWEICLCI